MILRKFREKRIRGNKRERNMGTKDGDAERSSIGQETRGVGGWELSPVRWFVSIKRVHHFEYE